MGSAPLCQRADSSELSIYYCVLGDLYQLAVQLEYVRLYAILFMLHTACLAQAGWKQKCFRPDVPAVLQSQHGSHVPLFNTFHALRHGSYITSGIAG